jgi:hypothetical protein
MIASKKALLATAVLVLITVALFGYKPFIIIQERRTECIKRTEQAAAMEIAYLKLENLSESMAILVDIHKLSPRKLPSNAKMRATEYVEHYEDINDYLQHFSKNQYDDIKKFLKKLLNSAAESLDNIEKHGSVFGAYCSTSELLVNFCHYLDAVHSNIDKWASNNCEIKKDYIFNIFDDLSDLMRSTFPIYSGALDIQGM